MKHRIFVASVVGLQHLACGDGPATEPVPEVPDGAFAIVDGRIHADSNEHGLEAELTATHNQAGSMNLTRTTNEICINGEVSRANEGDFARYWGLSVGFVTGSSIAGMIPSLGSSEPLSIDPSRSIPWTFGEQVVGISATLTGPVMPPNLVFEATPGGKDPGGQFGEPQELTIYGSCNTPFTPAPGRRLEARFADLDNWWCVPDVNQPWIGDSVISFSWKVVAVVVPPETAVVSDAYDFCLSDIRPILALTE